MSNVLDEVTKSAKFRGEEGIMDKLFKWFSIGYFSYLMFILLAIYVFSGFQIYNEAHGLPKNHGIDKAAKIVFLGWGV